MGNTVLTGINGTDASRVECDVRGAVGQADPMRPSMPGSLLRDALAAQARAAGSSLRELVIATHGTEHDYRVLNGDVGSTARLGRRFVEACARRLELPPVAVKCLAGELVLADFVMPGAVPGGLNGALARVGCPSLLACLIPRQVHSLDDETQRFVVRCLEEASGQILLKPPFGLQEIRTAMQAAMSVDDELGRRRGGREA